MNIVTLLQEDLLNSYSPNDLLQMDNIYGIRTDIGIESIAEQIAKTNLANVTIKIGSMKNALMSLSAQPVLEKMSPGIVRNLCMTNKEWSEKCSSFGADYWANLYAEYIGEKIPKYILEKGLKTVKNYYFLSTAQIVCGNDFTAGIRDTGGDVFTLKNQNIKIYIIIFI